MASLIGPPSLRQSPTPPAQHPTGDPFVDLMVEDFNNLAQAPLRPQMGFTENGSATFVTTGDPCLDLFFHVVPDSSFTGLKKKKKKKPIEASLLNEETGEDAANPWDRDYEELLGRVYSILREKNPELAAGDCRRRRTVVMRPPQVLREGTKKTVFVNFMDLCKTMHRQPEHVQNFLLAELGTSGGSLDGQQRLVVKGRFAPKDFEGILRRYVNEYVICLGCKSPDTILSKENRLCFLRCDKCGSGRSVAQIKQGFVARVGRRNAAGA